ncbi:hypothetical protein ACFWB2_40740 [Streptomyces virginiae]|uniref:hypothetical protein n=1 Tax=Streptomyces virginiae TaxID=1961 RepID=UPI0036AEEF02
MEELDSGATDVGAKALAPEQAHAIGVPALLAGHSDVAGFHVLTDHRPQCSATRSGEARAGRESLRPPVAPDQGQVLRAEPV